MDLNLNGKIVLVTGGSKGIGLACASAFLAEGAKVAICSRAAANIQSAKDEFPALQGFAADLTDASAAAAMLREVESQLGPIDILVNSAGAAKFTPADQLTPAVWRANMDAKYFSYINVIDPLIKQMAERGTGVIVNIIGTGGKFASAAHISGGAANAALMLATAGLATAYAAKGIRVVGLSPGATETGRIAESIRSRAHVAGITPEEAHARAIAGIPMGRMGTPDEIAAAVVFLASPKASYISGINLTVDGAAHPVI